MMQLKAIGLWNAAGELRRIDLRLGALNVITGESESGKSTLIDIVRWCLGGDELRIPDGPIRQTVTQFGLLVQLDDSVAFIGRPMLPQGQQTGTAAQLEIGMDDFPAYEDLRVTTNRDALRDWLASAVGIEENTFEIEEWSTRHTYPAGFGHAEIYCFLRQDEIASQRHLFHQQSEDFMPQAIKDTLPYFLGATGPEDIGRRHELRRTKVELRKAQRLLDEANVELTTGQERAASLVSEATGADLLPESSGAENLTDLRSLLQVALDAPPSPARVEARSNEQWQRLQRQRFDLSEQARRLREQRDLLGAMASDGDAFSSEANEQATRLQTLHLLHPADDEGARKCPVCASQLDEPPASVEQLTSSLEAINLQLASVERERPQLVAVRQSVIDQEQTVRAQLDENLAALDALTAQDELITRHQELINLQSYVRGRISQFLASSAVTESSVLAGLQREVECISERAQQLQDAMDRVQVMEDVTTRLQFVSRDMTEWAIRLDLEHSHLGVRIDPNRLTVLANSELGAIRMDPNIGSGKNWVGYHLVTYLALQKWFINQSRPVPSFVMFDQPTQAFYRPEHLLENVEDADQKGALSQFELLRDVVLSMDGRLQVIVLDHADYDEPWFNEAVVERWRGGDKLIPQSWIDALDA